MAKAIKKLDGPRPNLAIILVGDRSDSQLYVGLKEKEGKRVGIDTHLYKMASDISEDEILATINFLNADDLIDGILVQLPLPERFNTDKIINAIKPAKDVDGFHSRHPDYILSPVLASLIACLEEINFDFVNHRAAILYNSEVFGESVRDILVGRGMEIAAKGKTQEADLLVTALGQPGAVKKEMIKEGVVIIDIGITTTAEGVRGDVDFNEVKDKAAFITPVPGGIGPMTIAFLFKNVWEIFKRREK